MAEGVALEKSSAKTTEPLRYSNQEVIIDRRDKRQYQSVIKHAKNHPEDVHAHGTAFRTVLLKVTYEVQDAFVGSFIIKIFNPIQRLI